MFGRWSVISASPSNLLRFNRWSYSSHDLGPMSFIACSFFGLKACEDLTVKLMRARDSLLNMVQADKTDLHVTADVSTTLPTAFFVVGGKILEIDSY